MQTAEPCPDSPSPEEIIEACIQYKADRYEMPNTGHAIVALMKALKMRFLRAKWHVDAYVLEHPGAFPKYRPPNPSRTPLWIVVDILLAGLNAYWAWDAWAHDNGWPSLYALIALFFLWTAKNQFGFLRFLAERKSAQTARQSA